MAMSVMLGAIAQNREQMERDAVKIRGEKFFKDIATAFSTHSSKKGPNWYNVGNNGKQFLVENISKYGVKKTSIQGQFDVMEDNKKITVELVHFDMGTSADQSTKESLSYYTTTYEVKSVTTYNGEQEISRNSVNIKWCINWGKYYDKKKDAWKKGALRTDSKIKKSAVDIVSITTNAIPILTSEKREMAGLVTKAIQEWYADVNNNFEYQKAGLDKSKCVTPLKSVDPSIIKVSESNINTAKGTITVGSMPAINVNAINPYDFIPENEQSLYTNPEASWNVSPTFTVDINLDAKKAQIVNVAYKSKNNKPVSDPEKERRLRAAGQTVSDFMKKLNTYASAEKKDKQLRQELEGMFVDKKAKCIQFTLIDKKGNENTKYVDKPTTPASYLAKMPRAEFEMTPRTAFLENNGSTAVIRLNQNYTQLYPKNYKGEKYADRTIKSFTMKYDETNSTWLIEKIDAQVGTTYQRDYNAE